MIMKTLTAGVLAVSLTLTSLAPNTASAEFSNEDAIAGVLTLLLLGAAIHNRNDRSDDRSDNRPAAQPDRGWRNLPGECLRRVNRRNGNQIQILGRRCMNQNYAHTNRLPQECHVQVRAANGERRAGYGTRCLRNQGFRINQH